MKTKILDRLRLIACFFAIYILVMLILNMVELGSWNIIDGLRTLTLKNYIAGLVSGAIFSFLSFSYKGRKR